MTPRGNTVEELKNEDMKCNPPSKKAIRNLDNQVKSKKRCDRLWRFR